MVMWIGAIALAIANLILLNIAVLLPASSTEARPAHLSLPL